MNKFLVINVTKQCKLTTLISRDDADQFSLYVPIVNLHKATDKLPRS